MKTKYSLNELDAAALLAVMLAYLKVVELAV
jgi:hypothetical protein